MVRVLLTGGGTGGHVVPLVAVARKIMETANSHNLQANLYYLGPDMFAKEILNEAGIEIKQSFIVAGKFRRYFDLRNFIDFFKTLLGIIQALFKVWVIMPDIIFSKGGYGSVGAVLAGWLYRIPIIIHESDSIPGKANKFLSRLANFTALAFKEASEFFPQGKTYFSGNPTRDGFFNQPQVEEREILDLKSNRPMILIYGSSQGSQFINDVVLLILPDLLSFAEVMHQTGLNNYEAVVSEAKTVIDQPGELELYHPIGFLKEQELTAAFHQANLVVGRASAGTIFEIAASAKPSILIPLSSAAQDHQRKNAYIFAQNGRAEIIEEVNLTPQLFLSRIKSFIENPSKASEMAQKAHAFATPNASGLIAEAILNLVS